MGKVEAVRPLHDLGPQIRAHFRDPSGDLLGRADGAGRFQNDKIARPQVQRQRPGRGFDIGHVRRVAFGEGRGHGDNEDVRGRRFVGGRQLPAADRRRHQDVEVGLVEVKRAGLHRADHLLADIDTQHTVAPGRQQTGRRQADIAQPHHANRLVETRHRLSRHVRPGRRHRAVARQ
jgi:hypothetical protein